MHGAIMTCAAVVLLAGTASANTVTLTFSRITSNATENVEDQFSVDVCAVAGDPNQVDFTFTNTAVIQSSISEVYFDDGTLLAGSLLTQSGANFTFGGAVPGDLPGGNTINPPFEATQQFSADAQGHPSNGLDVAADFLTIRFDLQGVQTYADTIAALENGGLRIGLHVRSIGNQGESDGFVNNPPEGPVIPLPTPVALAGIPLGLLTLRRRR